MVLGIQAIRFVIVGVASNLVLYALYLMLTASGVGSKTAMSGLYVLGVLQTFVFNKRWTFSHDGAERGLFVRYMLSYAFGYLLNFALLYLFVDQAGFSHQIIQGGAVVVVAVTLFLLQRYWVFARDTKAQIVHLEERVR